MEGVETHVDMEDVDKQTPERSSWKSQREKRDIAELNDRVIPQFDKSWWLRHENRKLDLLQKHQLLLEHYQLRLVLIGQLAVLFVGQSLVFELIRSHIQYGDQDDTDSICCRTFSF